MAAHNSKSEKNKPPKVQYTSFPGSGASTPSGTPDSSKGGAAETGCSD